MDNDTLDLFAITIFCMGCGQVGSVFEERPEGHHRTFIRVSNGFHPSDARTPCGDPQMILCDRCDGSAAF